MTEYVHKPKEKSSIHHRLDVDEFHAETAYFVIV